MTRDFEAMFDMTDFFQSFLVQNQIYSSQRFINFLDDKFIEVLEDYLIKKLSKKNLHRVCYLQVNIFKNNSHSSLLINYKKTHIFSFKRLFETEITRLFIDLENSFLIDKETFMMKLKSDPLISIFLGIPCKYLCLYSSFNI